MFFLYLRDKTKIMNTKTCTLTLLFFGLFISFAQQKEKIKGSKIVTITLKEVSEFQQLEVGDNFEVFFVKNNIPSIEIEADDNLHETVQLLTEGKTLKINASKEVVSAKKYAIRVNYNDSLKTIIGKNESKLNALASLDLQKIKITNYDQSKSFLNSKSADFMLVLHDKATAEINVTSEKITLQLDKEAVVKALLNATETKVDLYQKAQAEIEGDTQIASMRIYNNCRLTAKKFTVRNLQILAEGYTKNSINASLSAEISASGKTEIDIHGEPKINLIQFTNTATLYKKEK